MTTKPWAIAVVVFCTLLTTIGQLTLKIGVTRFTFEFYALLTNYPLWIGFILYFFGAGLLIIALKYGELSVLYPIIALSFVWVSLLSGWILNETVTMLDWIGIVLIIIGVSSIGYGSRSSGETHD